MVKPEPVRTCFAAAATSCPINACECLCVRPLDHKGLCLCANCNRYYKGVKP